MLVAGITAHRKNGFFIFRPGQGWEYVMILAVAAFAVGAIGAGEWSIDHALGWDVDGLVGRDRGRRRRRRRRRPVPGRVLAARRPRRARDATGRAVDAPTARRAGHARRRKRARSARPPSAIAVVIVVAFGRDVDLRVVLRARRQHRPLRRPGLGEPGRRRSARPPRSEVLALPARRLVQGHRAQGRGPPAAGGGDRPGHRRSSTARSADLRATEPTDAEGPQGRGPLAGRLGRLPPEPPRPGRPAAGRPSTSPSACREQGGAPVTLRMDAFAKTNGMPSCIVPDDIG